MKIELETLISECIVYDFKLILEKMKFNTCRSMAQLDYMEKR